MSAPCWILAIRSNHLQHWKLSQQEIIVPFNLSKTILVPEVSRNITTQRRCSKLGSPHLYPGWQNAATQHHGRFWSKPRILMSTSIRESGMTVCRETAPTVPTRRDTNGLREGPTRVAVYKRCCVTRVSPVPWLMGTTKLLGCWNVGWQRTGIRLAVNVAHTADVKLFLGWPCKRKLLFRYLYDCQLRESVLEI